MSLQVILCGIDSEILEIKSNIEQGLLDEFRVADSQGDALAIASAHMGASPLEYLVIVYFGHLSAGLTHDAIRALIRKKFSKDKEYKTIEISKVDKNEDQP